MCYAFMDKFATVDHTHDTGLQHDLLASSSSLSSAGDSQAATIQNKRRASTTLQHEPSKAAKLDHAHDATSENSAAGSRKETDQVSAHDGFLTSSAFKEKSEIERLKETVAELEDEQSEWRSKLIEAGIENRELSEKLRNAKAKGTASVLAEVKAQEKSIKEKYEKKAAKLTADHDKKFQDLKVEYNTRLQNKHKSFQQRVDIIKDEQIDKDQARDSKIKDFRDKDQERQEEIQRLKADHASTQKDLKADLQEKLKEARPETNKAVKEKVELLKAANQGIDNLKKLVEKQQDDLKKAETHIEGLQGQKAKLTSDLTAAHAQMIRLQGTIEKSTVIIEVEKESKAKMVHEYSRRLQHESKRWQLLRNISDKTAQEKIQIQRACSAMSHAMNRRDEQIGKLEDELGAAMKRLGDVEAGVAVAASSGVAEDVIHTAEKEGLVDAEEVQHLEKKDAGASGASTDKTVRGSRGYEEKELGSDGDARVDLEMVEDDVATALSDDGAASIFGANGPSSESAGEA